MRNLLVGLFDSLSTALDAKSAWTRGHSQRVTDFAVRLGRAVDLSSQQLFELRLAALLHDMGKISTSDAILDKPGKLSAEEFDMIKEHPVKTYEILKPMPRLQGVARAAKHHHERWDGCGYPDGLAGVEIPLLSRILTLADCYDAMGSDRPYREGLDRDTIVKELSDQAGIQFDPGLAVVFLDIIGRQSKPRRRRTLAKPVRRSTRSRKPGVEARRAA